MQPKAREDALRMRDDGDFGGAATVLREMAASLSTAPADFGDLCSDLHEQADDLADMAARFDAEAVSEEDA